MHAKWWFSLYSKWKIGPHGVNPVSVSMLSKRCRSTSSYSLHCRHYNSTDETMHVTQGVWKVKITQGKKIKYAVSQYLGRGRVWCTETFEQQHWQKQSVNWKPVIIISHQKGTGQEIPVGQLSLDKGCTSTAANVFSFLQVCRTLKQTPPELLGHYSQRK